MSHVALRASARTERLSLSLVMKARAVLPLMAVVVCAFATAADPLRIVIVGDSTVSEYRGTPEQAKTH